MGALERAGAKLFVERLRLEWRPGTPVAELSGRLTFRPVRNPGELIELTTLVISAAIEDVHPQCGRELCALARVNMSGTREPGGRPTTASPCRGHKPTRRRLRFG